MVDVKYFRDWHAYLATTLGVVVVTFDGRGTGFKGRKFRMPVSGHLGDLESLDVVKAAKYVRYTVNINRLADISP